MRRKEARPPQDVETTMRKTTCEWKTSDGKHTCAIGTNDDGGGVWVWSSIDGKIERECAGPHIEERTVNGVKIAASIGRLALTPERLSALEADCAAAIEVRKNTPAGLRRERESLADLCRADYSDAECAWGHEEENECFRLRAAEDMRVAKAMEAIEEFDAHHPEVLKTIKREQAEMVNRHVWD
jgi:hypothetical protein